MDPRDLKIGLYTGFWNSDNDFNSNLSVALRDKIGAATSKADNSGSLYFQFKKDGEFTLNVKTFSPFARDQYDLIFLFDRCVGVNKEYQLGDLVLIDHASVKTDFVKKNIDEISACFQVVKPNIVYLASSKILKFMSENNNCSARSIKSMLGCTTEEWSQIFQKVIEPNIGKYWNRDEDTFAFSLTEEGKQEVAKIVERPIRKPAIQVGNSHCTSGIVTSLASQIPSGVHADVMDQNSVRFFNLVRSKNTTALNVCAVKCLTNEDIEEESLETNAMFNNFAEFLLKTTEIFRRQISE